MDLIPTTVPLLDVQDILYHIFLHLDPDRFSWEDVSCVRRTLVSSALACRNFTRPALSVLWRSLPSDRPLISLLRTLGIAQDNGLVSMDPSFLNNPYGLFSLEDPRTNPSWSRFREYATRVRKVQLEPSVNLKPFERKLPMFWTGMSRFLQDEPILPLLHSANIAGDHDKCTLGSIQLPLISPTVRVMGIWLKANATDLGELERVLSEACARAPYLETITLAITPWKIDLSLLHRNPHLRSVSVHAQLAIRDIEPLTHLEELEHLSVVLSGTDGPAPILHLPSLRRLSLRGVWASISDLVEQVRAPQMYSLTLHVSHEDPGQLIHESRTCIQTVVTRLPVLETLSIYCPASRCISPWDLSGALDTEGAFMAAVEPLLSLHRLRHVSLDFRLFVMRLASDDLHKVSEAWPDVEELRINVATVGGHRAGFESTIHLARHCPRLRVLHFPTMDLSVGAFDGLEYPGEPHPLQNLDVAEVVFPHGADLSHEMAEFTQRVFPNAAVPFIKHPIVVTDEKSGDRPRRVV